MVYLELKLFCFFQCVYLCLCEFEKKLRNIFHIRPPGLVNGAVNDPNAPEARKHTELQHLQHLLSPKVCESV